MIRASCFLILVLASLGYALEPRAAFSGKLAAPPGDRPQRYVSVQGLTEAQKTKILARHDMHRGRVSPSASNMPKLQWDDEIAKDAQEWAEQCIFDHNSSKDRMTKKWPWVGQNLGWGHGVSMYTYIDVWVAEKALYNYDSNSCHLGQVCGHYTQVAWADTKFIGCGWNDCGRNDYLVCHYGPGGNYHGERPYESGTSCSNCPYGYGGGCESDLCQMG